ncbi:MULTISPECIES: Fe-S protein assembly co-chaperone HscB [Ectothiorhodospira]|uniref:Fe-S protein assembly co-chaperone HscB n=1 Tax=Ectothiorhodospira TaxID=1051 RepID=UPI0004B77466|nr:Fe-S protein assembly co-chaperone HscB [Ectothiorhodospira haloalkaliphila]MCG5493019.1 Fe-S protein assembly co-chaperone HscB [Ectothiorhodospira variabilis]MCG5497260.1 Fe-S protein assembly co-chaperone HscB [Ectothiorhodospira variabilis]MCG5502348.1 Fe-S protein assembly co-chaperone HscB [Ectothiorhodospira variabilis]MCG5505886.1 Fe-S protein assembly co-chaperone HscB [Ectothiorhodospira variabilis]MCG5524533.1 Fe-S protein assembly co-chaperone HscB [Ectothiorhodospira haloalkali
MDLDFSRNYFELFGLPQRFRVDQQALMSAYRELQSALHPDRFAHSDDQARRLAVQGASHVNEAYATLKDDGLRARYLLGLKGAGVDVEKESAHDPQFLLEQMELREALEEVDQAADPLAALDALSSDIETRYTQMLDAFEAAFEANDLEAARQEVLKLRFFDRLREEVARISERLEDQLLG